MSKLKNIKAEALKKAGKGIILDVRSTPEHREMCLKKKHIHIPLDNLDPDKFQKDNKLTLETPIYLLCRHGIRSATAAERLMAFGFKNVYVVEGGIEYCKPQGLVEIISTSRSISLEEQVRIGAGSIVLVGVFLGAFIHHLFYIVPAFIGLGLIVSGITGWCGMSLLLEKMPWNKR